MDGVIRVGLEMAMAIACSLLSQAQATTPPETLRKPRLTLGVNKAETAWRSE